MKDHHIEGEMKQMLVDQCEFDEDEDLPLSFQLWKPSASQHIPEPLPNIGSFASGYNYYFNIYFSPF